MTTALLVLSLLLGSIGSAGAAAGTAPAAGGEARDIDGRIVALSGAPHVLVFWSMQDADGLAGVRTLQAAGASVVLVNTDAASERSMIRPFLAARGVAAPVVADPTHDLAARLHAAPSGSWIVLDAEGGEVLRQLGAAPDVSALASALRDCEAAERPIASQ